MAHSTCANRHRVQIAPASGRPSTFHTVWDLFLSGQRDQAIAMVPDELCDEISLVGPKERIRERLEAWKESPVTMINVGSGDPDTLRFMAEELL